ncbi:molybdopterin molybdotransferase MoeA [Alteromonadaceae bacterium BrNp21-10]|nr:molybdopterin molybdotransferase MoeA [Alteromonadaceae bacterium BrNp21-10]
MNQSLIDHCNAPGLIPVEDAIDSMLAAITPVTDILVLPVTEALGYVLADAVLSQINVPPAANSAMDGYALAVASIVDGNELQVIGSSFAGAPFNAKVDAGQCVRIMTGGIIPVGTDAIVMQENTESSNDVLRIINKPRRGENIRLSGEDIQAGQLLLAAGHKISAVDIGLLCSIGVTEVRVFRKLKVALFSTGNELQQPGIPLELGEIYDSNRPALHAMLNKIGIEVLDLGVIEDRRENIASAFEKGALGCDAVITSGGVSVGEADFTKEVLQELGQIAFWKIAMKPGKPFAFGHLPGSYFFGLPGNPVSALVTFYQLVIPALSKLSGQNPQPVKRLTAIADERLRKRPGRADFQRGIYKIKDDGKLYVTAAGKQGSGVLTSIANANCFIVLEQQRGDVASGENVKIELFADFFK